MEFFQVLEGRSSMRAFLPGEVDKALLEKILQAVRRSPSFMNTQPWEVFVATGKKKEDLSSELLKTAEQGEPPQPDIAFPASWPEALEKRLTTHRLRRFEALGIDPNDKEKIRLSYLRNFKFFDAPCVVFIGLDKALTSWSMFDLGLFVHAFLMALHAEGLGGCPQAMLSIYPGILRKHLGIAGNIKIALGISLGYPDYDAAINKYKAQRMDITEFVHWY
ncbi:MAG: nitroreductase [Smithellaceae bacterium]